MRRFTPLVLVAALILAGCGDKKNGAEKAEAVPAVTASSTTTSTTAAPTAPPAPLTNLPLEDPTKGARPAMIVKIDNSPAARPQAGIIEADVVFEEQVEGGITRLAAIFHSTDSDPVGPIRSFRTTDINIGSALNKPLLAYSGANKIFLGLLRKSTLVDVGIDAHPNDYRRDKSRRGPSDLFSDTSKLFKYASATAAPPPALFQYRAKNQPFTGAGAVPFTHTQVTFNQTLAVSTWDWDPAAGAWKRGQNGTAHTDLAGRQVAAKNVIIQFTRYGNVPGIRDASGSPVPEADLVGQGEAWLLSEGQIVKGTWSKTGATAVTTYTDSAGTPFQLTPGQTWVELAPAGSATS